MENKPIHIHTEPGYIEAKDDAALNMANERRSGVYTKFASGFAFEKTAALTGTLKQGIYSHQGHKYICYSETIFSFIAAATGQKKICYLISEYVYKSNNVQEHTLKVLQGASSANPVPPALLKKDLFAIEATSTSQEAIYQIDITEGNITKISLVTSALDGVDVNDITGLQVQIDKKTDKSWSTDEQTRVNAEFSKKGDITYINQQDALKVDKTTYDAKMLDIDSKNGTQDTAIAAAKSAADTANTNAIAANTNADSRVKQTVYDAKIVLLDAKDKAQDDAIKVVQTANDANATNMTNKVDKKGDVMSGALQLPPTNPSGDYHATHKNYVDVQDSKKVDKTTYDAKMVALDNKNSTHDALIATKTDKTYVDAQDNKNLSLIGGTMTGPIQLPSANPTVATQATHKSYVDTRDALKADITFVNAEMLKQVSKSGDIMSGMLTLPLTKASEPRHATNKQYVDDLIAKQVTITDTADWQKQKITTDVGGTIGITKGVTFSKYFQDNPTMLRHFYANATDNTDSPGTLRGIIGNTGSVSTTAPNGVFWGIGIDYQRKLYGTHSKGNSSTTVEWVRYLDERDEDRIQLPSITKSDGKAKYVTTAGQTMTTFIASLPVGLNTVQIYSSHLSSGYPLGTGSQLRGDIFKMDANSANYKYGVCVVDLSDNSTNKLTFKGTLYGPEDIVSAEWLAIRVQRDMWETIYTSTTGLLLSSNKTLTVRKGMPKMVRITLEGRPIIEGNLEIMVNARKTVNVSTPHNYQSDGFFYGLFEFFDGSVKFERTFTGGASNTLMRIEAIY